MSFSLYNIPVILAHTHRSSPNSIPLTFSALFSHVRNLTSTTTRSPLINSSRLYQRPKAFLPNSSLSLNGSSLTPLSGHGSSWLQHTIGFHMYSTRESRRQNIALKRRPTSTGVITPVYEQTPTPTDTTRLSSINHEDTTSSMSGYDPQLSSEELITPSVMQHLRKVYSTIAAMLGMSALGGLSSVVLPVAALASTPMIGLLGSIGCMLGIYFSDKSKIMLRQNLLLGFGFLSGLSMTGLLAMVSATTIVLALAGTTAIFAGFSLAALRAKSTTFLSMSGILYGSVLFLFGLSLVGLIGPLLALPVSPAFYAALHNVNLYLGLGIFSFFISYDTQRMIASAYEGDTDHVTDALGMFINVYSVFIRLLSIFRDD